MGTAKGNFMKAAREGDLAQLKLFVENGIDVDCVDYDISTALHVAAIADQPVAVDFLLAAKANVNARSRWGTSPLDEAIASESIYCCKLIAACGGKAYVNFGAAFAKDVIASTVTLEDIRKDINIECVTQSKRSRAMHKLKQLHAKLMEDVASSCETLSRQCKSIETVVSKLGTSRLTSVGARDQFQETILEFDDLDENKTQDSVLQEFLGYRNGESLKDDEKLPNVTTYAGTVDDSKYMLNRFLSIPSPRSRSGSIISLTSPTMAQIPGRKKSGEMSFFNDPSSANSNSGDVPPTPSNISLGDFSETTEIVFSTMNQVMLSYAKIEAGFCELKRIYDSYSEGNFKDKMNLFELECTLKACGLVNAEEASKDIMVQCNGQDQGSSMGSGDDESSQEVGAGDGVLSTELISFEQLISCQAVLDMFEYPENYASGIVNKIGLSYQLARATFNLLDSSKEGCVNVSNLRGNESIMGELVHGEELFKCFNNMENIYPCDMVTVLARWVAVIDDDDDEEYLDVDDEDSRSMGGDSYEPSSGGKSRNDPEFEKLLSSDGDSGKESKGTSKQSQLSSLLVKLHLKNPPVSLEDQLLLRLSLDYADNIEGIFSAYDVDNSGAIDREEFSEMIHHLFGKKFGASEIERTFVFFDYDSTGELLKHVFQKKLLDHRDSHDMDGSEIAVNRRVSSAYPSDVSLFLRELVFDADRSPVVKVINSLVIYAAFAYFILVPYEISLVYGSSDGNIAQMRIIGWCLDLILYADIFVKFHKTYISRRSVKVANRLKIRKHYLANGFSFDLFRSLPVDFIAFFVFHTSYKTLRWFRLPRLLTIADIGRNFKLQRHRASTNSDRIMVELFIFSFLLFALTHVPACLWFFLTNNDDEDTVLHNTKIQTTEDGYWFSGYGVASSNGWKFEQYMLSLYWVTGTISTMGQGAGELMPQNAKERIFTVFLMLLNLSIYAYILGAISQLFMIADEAMVEVREEVTLIESYIANNNFTDHLQGEVRATVKGSHKQGDGNQGGMAQQVDALTMSPEEAQKIYESLSHTLKVEVARHTCFGLLKNVSAFKDCNQNFMDSISTVLVETNVKPDTYVFRVNELSSDFYIVASGMVYVLSEDEDESSDDLEQKSNSLSRKLLKTPQRNNNYGNGDDDEGGNSTKRDGNSVESKQVEEGDVMGEIPFFFDTRHTTSAKTFHKSYVKLYVLAKEKYKRLLEIYPDEEEQIGKNVLSSSTLNIQGSSSDTGSSDGGSQSGTGSSAPGSSDGESSHDDAHSDCSASSAGTSGGGKNQKLGEIAKAVERARRRETNERVFSMCSAAASGNLTDLKKLCSSGVSLSEPGYGGRTPLHLAASEGQLKVVQWIVQNVQDINLKDHENHSPLVDAIENGWDDLAKYLRSQGAELDVDFAALMLSNAACDNDKNKLKLLFELGADPNINVAGRIRGGARRRRSALHFAASGGNVESVKILMENWASLSPFDGWGGTPLADSIREGHGEVQRILREGGAKLKEKGLCTAAAKGDLENIKVMVMNGVDINIGNYIGRTMLHLACSNKHMNVIDYLLKLPGLNPNVVDWYAGTPSEDASRGGFDSVCAALSEVGGVRSGHPSLHEDVKKITLARQKEKEKFFRKREEQKATDAKREVMLDEVSMLCKIAMEDIINARRMLDALSMSLAGRTWKKKEAIDKAPKPQLDEIVKYFLGSFQKFIVKKHALKLLKFYQFCVEFSTFEDVSVDEMCRIGQLEYDRYLDPLSPEFIAINPEHARNCRITVFEDMKEEAAAEAEGSNDDVKTASKLNAIHNAFGQVAKDLSTVLETKYLQDYFSSREFHEVATSVKGRAWRVLQMCKRSREICLKLEASVAVPMQAIVNGAKLDNMYGGAKAFNLTMREVSVDFQQKLLDTVEKIEVSAIAIKGIYEKQAKKKSIMVKNNNMTVAGAGRQALGDQALKASNVKKAISILSEGKKIVG